MDDSNGKVSIILPTYNGERYLREAVASCLGQTCTNLELIVVVDGSNDRTEAILKEFSDERMRVIRNKDNEGIVAALNKGFSLAGGEYLTWTSDDNYYDESALAVMAGYLANHRRIDFVYANYDIIDENGRTIKPGRVEKPTALDFDNYIGPCFLFRRRVYAETGEFNPDAFLVEDYEYWLRVRERFRMHKLDERLYYFRVHKDSLTSAHTRQKVQEQVKRVRKQFLPTWRQHYFEALEAHSLHNSSSARKSIMHSFLLNPFHYDNWRLMALIFLPPSWVAHIRKSKHSLKAE